MLYGTLCACSDRKYSNDSLQTRYTHARISKTTSKWVCAQPLSCLVPGYVLCSWVAARHLLPCSLALDTSTTKAPPIISSPSVVPPLMSYGNLLPLIWRCPVAVGVRVVVHMRVIRPAADNRLHLQATSIVTVNLDGLFGEG